MKKRLFPLLFLGFCVGLSAQSLTVKTVTIFKNGKSLLSKSGKVPAGNGRYSMTELPEALFGTYWVTGDDVLSVFAAQDSVQVVDTMIGAADMLRKNLGKPMILYLASYGDGDDMVIQGIGQRIFYNKMGQEILVVKVKDGGWASFNIQLIRRWDFLEAPDYNVMTKKAKKHLNLNFKTNKAEQEVGISYLVGKLGWTPVYRLELSDKTKGRLSLRAEIANDAEDLGDAEIRLAVGIPNFVFATKKSLLFDFGREFTPQQYEAYMNMMQMGNASSNAFQVSYDAETYEERLSPAGDGEVDGAQAEDFYFYTIRPGNFPKYSRFQYPIFETDIQPTHFYECTLPASNTQRPVYYQQKSNGGIEEKIPVTHYVEFKNTTTYPWTTGAANLLSQSRAGLQPLSQDMLPYTAPGATCKVKIAQTPEIKVTHGEGDVDRQENAKKFFSTTYDKVKIEAQVLAVNYKTEPVTLKICRSIEGTPLTSEQKWTTRQEQATLRVNPSHSLEWVIELKPGEERKWTYSYEVYVNM